LQNKNNNAVHSLKNLQQLLLSKLTSIQTLTSILALIWLCIVCFLKQIKTQKLCNHFHGRRKRRAGKNTWEAVTSDCSTA